MSLPPAFTNSQAYFEECMDFLLRYRELYWKKNTDILMDDLSFFIELTGGNEIESENGINYNEYSRVFVKELTTLAPSYPDVLSEDTGYVQSPMSQKKKHEVFYLTEEIKNMCESVGCHTVVDLGAGLGYIDNQLFVKTGFNVLGLEGSETNYVKAKLNQRKYYSESLPSVKYRCHIISENSDTAISDFLKDKFPDNKGFCFMGLHACADLSISAMNLFLKMEDSRALVLTPCCYHKMVGDAEGTRRFKNFPLSAQFKKIFEKYNGYEYLNVPFMRVAAQPYHSKEDMASMLQDIVFALLARAVFKLYAKKHNCELKKKRRKTVRGPSLNRCFTEFATVAITKGFNLVRLHGNKEETFDFNLDELKSMWRSIPKDTFTNAAAYISLQNQMPRVFENLILYDRLVYLKEQGINCCYYKKVVNEKISPKCLSLFASKDDCV